jgi:hypothetical protein
MTIRYAGIFASQGCLRIQGRVGYPALLSKFLQIVRRLPCHRCTLYLLALNPSRLRYISTVTETESRQTSLKIDQ